MAPSTLAALLASDRQFFEAGATNEQIGPATLSWMEGLAGVPAGCVVHSVDASSVTSPDAWLDDVEDRVEACGGSLVRIYPLEPSAPLERVLEDRGYSARTELAYATTGMPRPVLDGVALHHLGPDDDAWASVGVVHRSSGIGSAIHDADPDAWTELWRRKCASGLMDGFLITVDDEPCGSVGVLTAGSLLRLKNPLVDRRVRRRSVASSAITQLPTTDRGRGCDTMAAYVADGTGGQALIASVGFTEIGAQVEWLRVLP